MLTDFRHRRGGYFQPHPFQVSFALIASLILALFVILTIGVESAH
jgi:hypothetical protein